MKCSKVLRFALIAAAICLLWTVGTYATVLKAKVVDAETNEPIEGAVVVVVWWRPVFSLCIDSCRTVHDAAETLTDAQGNFAIEISMGLLANERRITIYRPGYHLPSYTSAPWLTSSKDPSPGETQIMRLIKAPSLRAGSTGSSDSPLALAAKALKSEQVTRIIKALTDAGATGSPPN